MKAGTRFYTHEAGDILAVLKRFYDGRKGYIRKAIGVVREKHLFSFKLSLDSFQALANI
jgi:hypothetical protein